MNNIKKVLLIISGGIAAYKSLDLIRDLRNHNINVRSILTNGGSQFITPLSLATLTEEKVYQDLFSLINESEMGHIKLSRDANLIIVAPATANLIAKMRAGIADDLATTTLLATDKPIFIAPSMNVRMWEHAATQENITILKTRGIQLIGPEKGDMACGEHGMGRMSEPAKIADVIEKFFSNHDRTKKKLFGKRAIVTSGPTQEAIDPARYISNHSSGQQGHAIAKALADQGAETTLISGPTQLPSPFGTTVKHVTSAKDMLVACKASLPADIIICAAAVSDWRIAAPSKKKMKKVDGLPALKLIENPDILAQLSLQNKHRPALVIGFAAETNNIIEHAKTKLSEKGCDWIIANNISPEANTFGNSHNTIHIISKEGIENWPKLPKNIIGQKLTRRIIKFFETNQNE
jgi:phosphopantothenoylcysteine decarboxylase/phosphopantothenate--cysteine ligase